MGTKGPSNHYGNAGGGRQGHHTKHINYPWAKDFNKHSAKNHYEKHNNKQHFDSQESYKQHAIKFANDIDRKNYKSFVDRETGKTYKYSPKSNEFIIVDKRGYIVTYYKPTSGYDYYKRQYAKYVKK
jgi:pyocin large subunit-like protein